jgi:hypothetical protein
VFSVIAIRDGVKSQPLRFKQIAEAMAEAEASSRHLAQSALVYETGEPRPRCIFERGELVVCRCPKKK